MTSFDSFTIQFLTLIKLSSPYFFLYRWIYSRILLSGSQKYAHVAIPFVSIGPCITGILPFLSKSTEDSISETWKAIWSKLISSSFNYVNTKFGYIVSNILISHIEY